jgi:N-methylhydantoinase A
VEAARRAIETRVAQPMGLGVIEAAWGIHRVVNENMAAAARVHGIERGKDLRGYPLFAFGGAGPVHAWQVGRILRVPRVLVPYGAGALSAYGLLAAPLAFDFVRTAPQRLTAADWELINRLFQEMETEGRRILRGAGVPDAEVTVRRSAEMRYFGQGHEVDVEVPPGLLTEASLAPITSSFETAYRLLYSRTPMGVPLEALNWRAVVSGPPPDLTITSGLETGAATAPTAKKHRAAYFPEAGGYVETPVYDRYRLDPGARLAGPAIVEERESTTVIGPGALISVDAHRNLVAEPASGEAR